MHWLADSVARVEELAPEEGAGDAGARRAFLAAIGALVDEAGRRPGVDAAFASYEGLLVAICGVDRDEAEALAAMAQVAVEAVRGAAGTLSLGSPRQLVVIGEQGKLALLRVGPVTVGLRCPVDVNLAASTAT